MDCFRLIFQVSSNDLFNEIELLRDLVEIDSKTKMYFSGDYQWEEYEWVDAIKPRNSRKLVLKINEETKSQDNQLLTS